jgi:hypothetical protein
LQSFAAGSCWYKLAAAGRRRSKSGRHSTSWHEHLVQNCYCTLRQMSGRWCCCSSTGSEIHAGDLVAKLGSRERERSERAGCCCMQGVPVAASLQDMLLACLLMMMSSWELVMGLFQWADKEKVKTWSQQLLLVQIINCSSSSLWRIKLIMI